MCAPAKGVPRAAPRHDCGPRVVAPMEPAHRARAAPSLLEAPPVITLQADTAPRALVLAQVRLHPGALAQVQLARVPARGLSGWLAVGVQYASEPTTRSHTSATGPCDACLTTTCAPSAIAIAIAFHSRATTLRVDPRTTPRRGGRAEAVPGVVCGPEPGSTYPRVGRGRCGRLWRMDGGTEGGEGARVGREDGAVRDVLVGWVPAARPASMHYAL
ncbi:hypothetical protein B0H14DRAFT_115607 [Mycena olivaceomarginata]|nr:hypothetical protein B0H14DRAFT_115607 [Mycena olivaceomarginata]